MNKQKVASGSLAVGRWLLRWTGTPGTGFAVGNNPVAAALPNEPLLTNLLLETCYLPSFITYLLFVSDHFYDILQYILAYVLPNEPLLTYYKLPATYLVLLLLTC